MREGIKTYMGRIDSTVRAAIDSVVAKLYGRADLVVLTGGELIECVDDQSDIDVLVITQEKQVNSFIDVGGYHIAFLCNNSPHYSMLFAYYMLPQHIFLSTPAGLEWLRYYKDNAAKYAMQYCINNTSLRQNFLEKSVFRKELYHQVYCYEILTNEKIDRTQLLQMKRGRANELLKHYLLKIQALIGKGE